MSDIDCPDLKSANDAMYGEIKELRTEVERLRHIEQAAQRAYDYHLLGYGEDTSDFDANDQIALMEALGRALEGKPNYEDASD